MKAAIIQMTSTNNVDVNFELCAQMIAEAQRQECIMACLPECFAFIGAAPGECAHPDPCRSPLAIGEAQSVAEPLTGPLMGRYRELAREHRIWLSLGGFQERPSDEAELRVYNTHCIVNDQGTHTTRGFLLSDLCRGAGRCV